MSDKKTLKVIPNRVRINGEYIRPTKGQFIIDKEYDIISLYAGSSGTFNGMEFFMISNIIDEFGEEVGIEDSCFEDVLSNEDLVKEEYEIRKLEESLKNRKKKLESNREKLLRSLSGTLEGSLSYLRRNMEGIYETKFKESVNSRIMTSGFDFGSMMGDRVSSHSEPYHFQEEIFEWFEKNLEKYGDRIKIVDSLVFDMDWIDRKPLGISSVDKFSRHRKNNLDLFLKVGGLGEEKDWSPTSECHCNTYAFGIKFNTEEHISNDDMKTIIHNSITEEMDKRLEIYEYIVIQNMYGICMKDAWNQNQQPFQIHYRTILVDENLLLCKTSSELKIEVNE